MADNSSTTADDNENEKGALLLAARTETNLVKNLTLGLGSLITLIVLTWAIEFWLKVGFQWFDEQAMATCLGLTLAIIFIRYPFSGGRDRSSLPWYDVILAVVGLATCLYLAYIYGDIELNPFEMRPTMFVIGVILIPMVWESLRRTTGWSLTLVFSVFVAYVFVGHLMPGMLEGREQRFIPAIAELGVTNVAIMGLPMKIIVLTVVLFIWMGQLLLHTGASEWFTDVAAAIMGRSRGRVCQDRRRGVRSFRVYFRFGGIQRRLDRRYNDPLDATGGVRRQNLRRHRSCRVHRRTDYAADHGRRGVPDGRAAGA